MRLLDDPASLLEPTAFVDSDAPGVIAFAREVCAGEPDEGAKAVRLYYAAIRPVHPRTERVDDHRVDPEDIHPVLLLMKPGANGPEPPRTGPRPDGGTFP